MIKQSESPLKPMNQELDPGFDRQGKNGINGVNSIAKIESKNNKAGEEERFPESGLPENKKNDADGQK